MKRHSQSHKCFDRVILKHNAKSSITFNSHLFNDNYNNKKTFGDKKYILVEKLHIVQMYK